MDRNIEFNANKNDNKNNDDKSPHLRIVTPNSNTIIASTK